MGQVAGVELPASLVDSIRAGSCVLFLGAGVSIDCGAPSGGQLADELSDRFLSSPSGSYSLMEAVAIADAQEGRKAINEWLGQRFGGLVPSTTLLALAGFRWRSIYTVNFDTLVEQAYASGSQRQQELRTFYSNLDRISDLQPGQVAFYKLHGCLSRCNSDEGWLTLTADDYRSVRKNRDRLLRRLLDDASDWTVLYVGFSRSDPDFTDVLSMVEEAAGPLGLRRSYAVQPNFTDAEARRWEHKKITLLATDAHGLVDALNDLDASAPTKVSSATTRRDDPLVARFPSVDAPLVSLLTRNFEIVDGRLNQNGANGEQFFMGASPTWGSILERLDAERDIKDDVLAAVLEEPLLDRGGPSLVLIHAEAGSGKTTLLRRIGIDLALDWDRVVVALKPYGDLPYLDVEKLCAVTGGRTYLLVDNASRVVPELSGFLRNARASRLKVTIVATARTNEWREAQGSDALKAQEFELGLLSRPEIERVIARLETNSALGALAGLSKDLQIAAFESRAGKQLLVALREATDGRPFDEIVVDEYRCIPSSDGQRAYLLICAVHRFGLLVRARLLHRASGVPFVGLASRVFQPTEKVIVAIDMQGDDEPYYASRHPLIADIVFDRALTNERLREDFYKDLISQLDLGYDSDAEIYRQLSRGMNRTLLRTFSSPAARRDLMAELIDLNPKDALARQHAAMMELDLGDLEAAGRQLAEAIAIRPNDPSIRDTEGRLLTASAVREADPVQADHKFQQAENAFKRNIQRRSDEPYGYRHLSDNYAKWADRVDDPDKRVQYTSLAYQALLDGLVRCGTVEMLLQSLGEMEARLGNIDGARVAFSRVLDRNPGALTTRLMFAAMEDKDGDAARAEAILLDGLGSSGGSPELQYRLADVMARVDSARESLIIGHFEAALLGPAQDYRPRVAYAAYLFERKHYDSSAERFSSMDQLVVTTRQRYSARIFPYGRLKDRQSGPVGRVTIDGAWISIDQAAASVFWPNRSSLLDVRGTTPGTVVSFSLAFNLKGPVATDVTQLR